MFDFIIPAILVILVLILLTTNIRVVQQSKAYVVERLGAYHATWGVGIHFKIPFIERVAKTVSLKEQVVDFAPQPYLYQICWRYLFRGYNIPFRLRKARNTFPKWNLVYARP